MTRWLSLLVALLVLPTLVSGDTNGTVRLGTALPAGTNTIGAVNQGTALAPTVAGWPTMPWGMADSLAAGGIAAAPLAGAAIATLAAPPAGTYRVKISVAASADTGNMQVQKGAAVFLTGLGVIGGYEIEIPRMALDGLTAVSVNATTAAALGSVYAATIVATRIF